MKKQNFKHFSFKTCKKIEKNLKTNDDDDDDMMLDGDDDDSTQVWYFSVLN